VIPRSQGKQPYYDARKADWGDLFPHEPRNGEVVRKRGIRRLSSAPTTSSPLQLPDEGMEDLQTLLNEGGKDPFGEKKQMGRPRIDKNEKRENHRRRKEWRRQAETGYR
jgi:ribosomal protein RSM22 (predicted rRNA methylase)